MATRILKFGGKELKPEIRYLNDMRELLYDSEWLKNATNHALYYMYRGLSLKGDDESIKKCGLRYDITIIPPMMLGCEYVKTAGHYHPVSDSGVPYPEVYEVLDGKAHYLLQKMENNMIADVVLLEAKKGDHVIIPPYYGHITINPSVKELKMANWISNNFKSVYGQIKEKHGGAYFELENGFVKNEHYEDVPELRFVSPKDMPEFGFKKGEPMYNLIKTPKKLEFLNRPERYIDLLRHVLD